MIVTYIAHSCFLIELNTCYLLFDYFTGELPPLKDKIIYVFSSHGHFDHFNKSITTLLENYNAKYILSSDIKKVYNNKNALYVNHRKEYNIDNIHFKTYKSTDLGVAFLINVDNKTIYHSGDLNDWVWEESTDEYNKDMTNKFRNEINSIKADSINIDIAFLPLDPRQMQYYYLGMKYTIQNLNINHIFPMHFGKEYDIINKFNLDGHNINNNNIYKISNNNESWRIQ